MFYKVKPYRKMCTIVSSSYLSVELCMISSKDALYCKRYHHIMRSFLYVRFEIMSPIFIF